MLSLDKLIIRRNIILKEDKEFKYILFPCNKEEHDFLDAQYDLFHYGQLNKEQSDFIKQIDMCGHILKTTENHCSNIIPLEKTHIFHETSDRGIKHKTVINEYKCYQEHKKKSVNDLIKHEDKLSSFNCAIQLIDSLYFIVLKQKINGDN